MSFGHFFGCYFNFCLVTFVFAGEWHGNDRCQRVPTNPAWILQPLGKVARQEHAQGSQGFTPTILTLIYLTIPAVLDEVAFVIESHRVPLARLSTELFRPLHTSRQIHVSPAK